MSELSTTPSFGDMPLHDLTREYGEDGLRRRLSVEINRRDWDEATRELVRHAEQVAIDAHQGDERGMHPYSTHFLRVAIRLVSGDHMDIDDPDMVIAALLHDTVEDHSPYYVDPTLNLSLSGSKAHAFVRIEQEFNGRVAGLVRGVTNPDVPAGVTDREERYEIYRDHVREVLATDEDAGLIKLSDFIDNCVGLAHNESIERATRLAGKYLPLIPDFYEFVIRSTRLSEATKSSMLAQLERAEDRCLDLLANA